MQSNVDNVASRVGSLTISPKPKRRGPSKSEIEVPICLYSTRDGVDREQAMNREDIKEFNVNRDYILQNQPWPSNALPPQYFPHRASRWQPPVFCLGVALSSKETEEFARHLGLPIDKNDSVVAYGIPGHLDQVCGANPGFRHKRCDQGRGLRDWVCVISLATNYDLAKGVKVDEALKKYRKIIEGAFGSSKQVAWWLEYTTNHTANHWWVSTKNSAPSITVRDMLTTINAVVGVQTGMDR